LATGSVGPHTGQSKVAAAVAAAKVAAGAET